MENGELLLMIVLVTLMLMWFAANLDMILDVRTIYICTNLSYNATLTDGIYTDISRCCATYGRGSGPIHMNNLGCSGTEFKLVDCYNSSSYDGHNEDWGVTCLNGNATS